MAHYDDIMAAWAVASRAQRAGHIDALRPMLMGQASPRPKPNTRGYPLFPNPKHSAGGRLWQLSEMSLEDWFLTFERDNTLNWFPGASGKGDRFPLRIAREMAGQKAADHRLHERTLVVVGKMNARAWGIDEQPQFTFSEVEGGGRWGWMNHPSGVNPFYNNPDNRAAARDFLKEAADG